MKRRRPEHRTRPSPGCPAPGASTPAAETASGPAAGEPAPRTGGAIRRGRAGVRWGRRSPGHVPSAALQTARASGVSSGAVSTSCRHRRSTSGSGWPAAPRSPRARRADDVVGILAGRKRDEAQRALGSEVGQGGVAARTAAFCPAASPSKQQIGAIPAATSARAGPRWTAVPLGATASAMPARSSAMTSISLRRRSGAWPGARRGGAVQIVEGAATCRTGRCRASSDIWARRAEDPPAERVTRRAQSRIGIMIRRGSGRAGLRVFLRFDQHAGVDELVFAHAWSAAFNLPRESGRSDAEALDQLGVDPAAREIGAAPRRLRPIQRFREPFLGGGMTSMQPGRPLGHLWARGSGAGTSIRPCGQLLDASRTAGRARRSGNGSHRVAPQPKQ